MRLLCAVLLLAASASTVVAQAQPYPDRWVFVSRSLNKDQDVDDIRQIVRTASEHGLNGMLFSSGLDSLDLQSPDYFRRLSEVKGFCTQYNVEIIPCIFSVGYGGGALAHDRNLAAGLLVNDALFVVKGQEANLVPDPPVQVVNGGFEQHQNDRFPGYTFIDGPGQISFADTQVFKEGACSLRFSNPAAAGQWGHARVMQEVTVKPQRHYRISAWVKTQDLDPPRAFAIQVLTEKGTLAPRELSIPATTDWRQVAADFNSKDYDKVRVYIGMWGWKGGMLWIDDIRVEEVGFLNVIRRPGTPVSVKSEDGKTLYEEGRDFARIEDPGLRPWDVWHQVPPLKLLPNSRITDGQRLRVSFYHAMAVGDSQVSLCMSEPKLYELWAQQARLLKQYLAPQKWLLSMDEIREGGSCAACQARNMTMAQILGDCISKQVRLIREVEPQAEVYIWSDMLDPNHNAHDNYYLVEGDFSGSWAHVPRDLIITCWYYEKRNDSLPFFANLGFRTLAGAYYDGDTLDNPRGWLESMKSIQGCRGIMYTTWQDKYQLLPAFGDLVTAVNR